jgi:hypothetical protein
MATHGENLAFRAKSRVAFFFILITLELCVLIELMRQLCCRYSQLKVRKEMRGLAIHVSIFLRFAP